MPSQSLKACSFPYCDQLVSGGSYRCVEHQVIKSDMYRGNAGDRGYDSDWQTYRKWFIARHPVCNDCQIVPTKEVHHIKKLRDYPELRLVEENCMGLCRACHQARTNKGQ